MPLRVQGRGGFAVVRLGAGVLWKERRGIHGYVSAIHVPLDLRHEQEESFGRDTGSVSPGMGRR